MITMKQFGLATLIALGATLCVSAGARAQSFDLTPTGAEPGAAGQADIGASALVEGYRDPLGNGYVTFRGSLYVTCQGLTPGATYWSSAGTFKAKRDGTGSVALKRDFFFTFTFSSGYVVDSTLVMVARINPDGSHTIVLSARVPAPF
jgi:hypothetical protein